MTDRPPPPAARVADGVISVVMAHRRWAFWGPLALALLAALCLPRLRTEFSPDALIGPAFVRAGNLDRIPFEADEPPLIVLLEAKDILAKDGVTALFDVSRRLAAAPWCARVDSIVWTPLPQVQKDSGDTAELTLDDLDADPDKLAIPVDQAADSPMARLVAAVPDRFPMGLVSAGQAMGSVGATVSRAVQGHTVTGGDVTRTQGLFVNLPSLRGRFVSRDRTAAMVIAVPRRGITEDAMNVAVRQLHDELAAHPPAGVSWSLGGLPAVRAELVDALAADRGRLAVLACLGSLAVLLLIFRVAGAIALPFAAVGLCVSMVMGFMAAEGIPMDLMNNVIPSLLVAIGLENAVHFVSRFQEERRRVGPMDAATRAARVLLVPCFLTSVTTAVGFAALAVSHTPAIVSFGWLAAAAAMLSYVVTFTFLPSALARTDVGPSATASDLFGRWSERMGRYAVTHARCVVAAAVLLSVGSACLALRVRVDGGLLENLDPRAPTVVNARTLEKKLGGIRVAELVLQIDGDWLTPASMSELEALTHWLRTQDAVLDVIGPSDFLRDGWGLVTGGKALATERWTNAAQLHALADLVGNELDGGVLSKDRRTVRLRVRFADVGSARIARTLDGLEAHVRAMPRMHFALHGEAYRASNGLRAVVRELSSSLAFATFVIFGLLFVVYRNWRFAAVSVPPNLLPLALTLAYMAMRGIPLHAATSIVFVVTVGIMVNGTIHILARYENGAEDNVVARTIGACAQSGRAVVTTAATLLVGFVALLGSSFLPIRFFGELSVVAIGTSLLCNYTLLPALLFLAIPRSPGAPVVP